MIDFIHRSNRTSWLGTARELPAIPTPQLGVPPRKAATTHSASASMLQSRRTFAPVQKETYYDNYYSLTNVSV